MNGDKKTGETSDDIVYYYDRNRRLENAPPEVKALYSGGFAQRKGIFRVLVNTKRNRYLFGSIVLLCIIIIIYSVTSRVSPGHQLGGAVFSYNSFVYEGSCYVSAAISPPENASCVPDSLVVYIALLDKHDGILVSLPFAVPVAGDGGILKQKIDLRDGAVYLKIEAGYNGDTVVITEKLQQ